MKSNKEPQRYMPQVVLVSKLLVYSVDTTMLSKQKRITSFVMVLDSDICGYTLEGARNILTREYNIRYNIREVELYVSYSGKCF